MSHRYAAVAILIATATLAGCAADLTTPVQTGKDRFSLYGGEAEVAGPAQQFCRERGFNWAETDHTNHDNYGYHTTFFCMNPGEKLVSIAPAASRVDVYNH
jgi:hypothetical protein